MKIFKRLLWFLAAILFLSAGGLALMFLHDGGYWGAKKIDYLSSYYGVNIGDSKEDVIFALGKPKEELSKDSQRGPVLVYNSGSGDRVLVFVTLDSKSQVVTSVFALAPGNPSDATSLRDLKWINSFSKPEDIRSRLGAPSWVKESEGGLVRTYHYPQNNIMIRFTQSRITGMGIGIARSAGSGP